VVKSNDNPTFESNTKVQILSIPPSLIARSYKSMATFGNHFQVAAWPTTSSMVTYDYGVIGEFAHTPPITHDNRNPKL
jgi:hypothetical protein